MTWVTVLRGRKWAFRVGELFRSPQCDGKIFVCGSWMRNERHGNCEKFGPRSNARVLISFAVTKTTKKLRSQSVLPFGDEFRDSGMMQMHSEDIFSFRASPKFVENGKNARNQFLGRFAIQKARRPRELLKQKLSRSCHIAILQRFFPEMPKRIQRQIAQNPPSSRLSRQE